MKFEIKAKISVRFGDMKALRSTATDPLPYPDGEKHTSLSIVQRPKTSNEGHVKSRIWRHYGKLEKEPGSIIVFWNFTNGKKKGSGGRLT